jgi:hypothetical protein
MNKFDIVANIAHFLQERKGSPLASWSGKLTAKEQRALFGAFLGKGTIRIDGEYETVEHFVKVGFGQDYDVTFTANWSNIDAEVERLAEWAKG